MATNKTVNTIFAISLFLFIFSCGKKVTKEEVVYFEEPVLAEEELEDTYSNSGIVNAPEYHFQEVLSYDDLRKKLNYLDGKGFVSSYEGIVLRFKIEGTYIGVNRETYSMDDDIPYYYKSLGKDDHLEKLNYIGEYSVNKDAVSIFSLGKDTLALRVSNFNPVGKIINKEVIYSFVELKDESMKDFFFNVLVSYDLTYRAGKLIYFIHLTKYEKLEDKVIFTGKMSEYLKYEKVNSTPQDMIISMATGDMVATAVENVTFIYERPPHDHTVTHILRCRQGFLVDLEVSLDGNDRDGYTLSGKAKSGGKEWNLKAIQHDPFEAAMEELTNKSKK
jgi:hypothetical protein